MIYKYKKMSSIISHTHTQIARVPQFTPNKRHRTNDQKSTAIVCETAIRRDIAIRGF